MSSRFFTNYISFSDNVTIYFLKDILAQKKRYLNNADVQTIHMPHYKCLSLERMFEFVAGQPKIELYLPDEPDLTHVPKQWIVNVCAAVIGEPFK